jgi:hypothetical protein
VFLVDPAQVAEGFSEGQGVGVSVSKPYGGHAPQLDVGVAVASSNGEDLSTAKSAEFLVLSVVVPWALNDIEALQGVDKEASKIMGTLPLSECDASLVGGLAQYHVLGLGSFVLMSFFGFIFHQTSFFSSSTFLDLIP